MTRIIDLHTHVVPPNIAPDPARGALWPSVEHHHGGRAKVMVGGKVFREVDSRCWDVARRVADMADEEVDVQVLSPMPELLSHWLSPTDAADLSAMMNDAIAEMVAQAPAKFVGLGMVPAQDPPAAVRMLNRIRDMNLAGIEIGTHIDNVPLGDRRMWPIYEAAEALNLAIFVHPLRPCGLERMGGAPETALVASFPLEIAMAAMSFLTNGVLQAFPRLRILLSHGGGALTGLLGRVEAVRGIVPPVQATLGEDAWSLARRFWIDSNVYDNEMLAFVVSKLGADRLVVGSDYPFVIRQQQPGAFVSRTAPGLLDACCGNSADFLFGERSGRGAALITG